jgi:hypothetical protein
VLLVPPGVGSRWRPVRPAARRLALVLRLDSLEGTRGLPCISIAGLGDVRTSDRCSFAMRVRRVVQLPAVCTCTKLE